jgi:hypothetical protein
MYQFQKIQNGNKIGKYYIGVCILQLPFFLLANEFSKLYGVADGFSIYYQLAIAWGAIIWVFISLIFFRKFLLQYYSDITVFWGLYY